MKPDSYDIKQDIGVVMQNVAVFEQMSVYENIDYFCGLYIKDKQKRKELVEEAHTMCEHQSYMRDYVLNDKGDVKEVWFQNITI